MLETMWKIDLRYSLYCKIHFIEKLLFLYGLFQNSTYFPNKPQILWEAKLHHIPWIIVRKLFKII